MIGISYDQVWITSIFGKYGAGANWGMPKFGHIPKFLKMAQLRNLRLMTPLFDSNIEIILP